MRNGIALSLLLFVVFTAAAWADTTDSTVSTTSTSATSAGENPLSLDHFYVGYYGDLEGSKLNQLGSPYQVNQKTGEMSNRAMTFASDATVAYMVTPNVGVGAYLEMNITPVLGRGWQWLDAGITTFDAKFVDWNGLTIYANAIVELPTTTYDINRGMYAGFETTPFIRYVVPHSRFAVGAWTEFKQYAGSTTGNLFKTYYEPYVSYSLIRRLSLNMAYELEWDHYAGTAGMQVYETDIQPGVIWSITPQVFLNPYLQWFTNNRITADSACFGASIVARVL